MNIEKFLTERSAGNCELCSSGANLSLYEVQPQSQSNSNNSCMLCATCIDQIDKKAELDVSHWQCLTSSMWSEIPAIQVLSWRMLNRFKNESWASESLDMIYLDEDNLAWAKAAGDEDDDGSVALHKDTYGEVLKNGDTVILTKSLDVKGTSLNAKLGTVVKNIRLVPENTEQIEGKIEGQLIVILTKYVRRQA